MVSILLHIPFLCKYFVDFADFRNNIALFRLEKERKEKKKQRKKEEIAKQKADGTYLTKSQKEEKARLEAARQMFLQSGNVKIAALEKQQETADGKENNNNNKNRQNNQFLAQKKKPGKGQKEKEDKLIEEQKAAEELKLKEIEEAKKKEPEVVDNWEDQSEDEDWEKMDEKDGDDISEKGSDELSSKQSQQDKVEALTNGLKAVKLENGQVPSKEEPVEDSESSDDESRLSIRTILSIFFEITILYWFPSTVI